MKTTAMLMREKIIIAVANIFQSISSSACIPESAQSRRSTGAKMDEMKFGWPV